MTAPNYTSPSPPHWLTRPATIRALWWVGGIVLALVTLAGKLVDIHPHFGIDGGFGFYSWYGFGTCVAMVVVAKVLGVVLKRKDTYYERD
jgi:hypothetical protein